MTEIAALVLAAGRSTRMGAANKLLLRDAAGTAMAARVVQACCASVAGDVVVVTGHEAALVERAIRAAMPGGRMRFVRAADYALGLSASLAAGIGAVSAAAAAIVCLGDMPLVPAFVLDRLIGAHMAGAIVVPVCGGERGNPVVWDRVFFGALAALAGDTGGRALLRDHADALIAVEVDEAGVLVDFDTPESVSVAF